MHFGIMVLKYETLKLMGNQWGTYVPCIQNLGNMAHGEPILEGNWAMAPHQQYGEHILAGKIMGNCDQLQVLLVLLEHKFPTMGNSDQLQVLLV